MTFHNDCDNDCDLQWEVQTQVWAGRSWKIENNCYQKTNKQTNKPPQSFDDEGGFRSNPHPSAESKSRRESQETPIFWAPGQHYDYKDHDDNLNGDADDDDHDHARSSIVYDSNIVFHQCQFVCNIFGCFALMDDGVFTQSCIIARFQNWYVPLICPWRLIGYGYKKSETVKNAHTHSDPEHDDED